jgi:hypothetical protein
MYAGRKFSGSGSGFIGLLGRTRICFRHSLRQRAGDPDLSSIPLQVLIVGNSGYTRQKAPGEILVHRNPLWARLYLFYLNPLFLEVIIRKNAESGSE